MANRKLLSIALTFILLMTVALTGCSGQKNNQTTNGNQTANNEGASNRGKVAINVMRPGDTPKVEAWIEPAKEEFNQG